MCGRASRRRSDDKTSTDPETSADYVLQLAVYANAGRQEGLNVRAAYVYDLEAADSQSVDVPPEAHRGQREGSGEHRAQLAQPGVHGASGPPLQALRPAQAVPVGSRDCDIRSAQPRDIGSLPRGVTMLTQNGFQWQLLPPRLVRVWSGGIPASAALAELAQRYAAPPNTGLTRERWILQQCLSASRSGASRAHLPWRRDAG